jgi:hypothetical protein
MISPLLEPTDVLMLALGIVAIFFGYLLHLAHSRNYWRRRATFFERQAYELLRTRPLFRRDDADWWKGE